MKFIVLIGVLVICGISARGEAAGRQVICLGTDSTGKTSEILFNVDSHSVMTRAAGSTSYWTEIFGRTKICGHAAGPGVSCTHEIQQNLNNPSQPNKFVADRITCMRDTGGAAISTAIFSSDLSTTKTGQFSCNVLGTTPYALNLSACQLQ
jgi:hypothetical protein